MSERKRHPVPCQSRRRYSRGRIATYPTAPIKQAPNQSENRRSERERIHFFLALRDLLMRKRDTGSACTTAAFAFIVSLLFEVLAVVGFVLVVFGIYAGIRTLISADWSAFNAIINIAFLAIWFGIIFVLGLYSVIIWASAKEIERTEDNTFVLGVFSGVTSLAALIVSLVALRS